MLVGVLGYCRGGIAVQALVFPEADGPLPLSGDLVVGGSTRLAQHAHHVVAVQDRELLLQPDPGAVLAQDAHAQAVEGGHHQVLGGARADQRLGALAHLLRRLVGEGDGRDFLGRQPGLQQAANLVRDHPRLARPRAGQHQARAVQMVHGLQLGRIEAVGGLGRVGHGAGMGGG